MSNFRYAHETNVWNKYDQNVPTDAKGNQLHYPESFSEGLKWEKNAEFADTLTYKEYQRGRSAAYFIFSRADGRTVTVFMRDMELMIPKLVKGKIKGTFTFCKTGMNYGCKLVTK